MKFSLVFTSKESLTLVVFSQDHDGSSHSSWQRLCMAYRVTCSSEFFLVETTFIVGINLLVAFSTALHAFSLFAS